ncbi:MAG: hypothetical protein JZU65_16055 [Chlorobium sp.]|nr:hypothetical protein [Chlorobium sp.]
MKPMVNLLLGFVLLAVSHLTAWADPLTPPENIQLRFQNIPTTKSITQHGITWTFAYPIGYGKFVNGDYWVVDSGSGVEIKSIAPLSTNVSGRIMNGSMINPIPMGKQGYDSTLANTAYDQALNAGRPGGNDLSISNPLVILGPASLVSTSTNATAGTRPQLQDAEVLTILTAPPPAGSFRPPYAGTNKTLNWRTANIQWQLLPHLSKSGITHLPDLAALSSQIERVWLDQGGGTWTGRYFHPSRNMPDYGRDMANVTSNVALALLLDYAQPEIEPLMIRFLQLGIDWYGVTESAPNILTTSSQGGLWCGGGGHGQGRKWPIIFAGKMFNDNNILKYANGVTYPVFQEEQQYFYVSQADVDRARYTADGNLRDPYAVEMIGIPEWGEQHRNQPNRDGSNWDAAYRDIVSKSIAGHVLAATLMGAKSIWNWPSFFDYQVRWAIHQKSVGSTISYSTFVDDMHTAFPQ